MITRQAKGLLPDPISNDQELEEVTLRNDGDASVSLVGWLLKDRGGRIWSLSTLESIDQGESITVSRNGMPMSLNNTGDEITLFDSSNNIKDHFTYDGSVEGQPITTGH